MNNLDRVVAGLFSDPAAAAALPWQEFRAGIEIIWLFGTPGGGPASALLRYQPGASAPRHRHRKSEHVLVIQGSQRDAAGVYPAGTLTTNPEGSVHEVFSDDGCVALLIWEDQPEFLD